LIVLVDSWAWIEYLKGSPPGKKAQEIIEGKNQVIIASINLAEIYKFLLENKPKEADILIDGIIQSSFIIPLETSLALKAAKIKHTLKMGLADAIVKATAEENHAQILTGDDDFKSFKDVIYIGN